MLAGWRITNVLSLLLGSNTTAIPETETNHQPDDESTYATWLEAVASGLFDMAEMNVDDFPDFDFLSLFAVGSTPDQATDSALLSIDFSRFS